MRERQRERKKERKKERKSERKKKRERDCNRKINQIHCVFYFPVDRENAKEKDGNPGPVFASLLAVET